MKSPCIECEERFVGCHSTCEAYGDFRKALDKKRATEKRERAKANIGRDRNFPIRNK